MKSILSGAAAQSLRARAGKTILAFVFLVNLSIGYKIYSESEGSKPADDGYKSISLLMNVLELLRENYVDPSQVSYDKLIHGALKGMLQELDPFSAYEEPQRFKHTLEETNGAFGGLGIVVTSKNNMIEVVAPMEDSPGFRAGIQPGDIIMEIDGKSTRLMDLQECVNLLKGAPGTKVGLTVYRKSEDSTKELNIERAVIEVSSIKGGKIIDDGIGYIRITQFTLPTAERLDEALKKLKQDESFKGLILDLRGNPGGLLDSAVQVCSRFIKKGELVVFTEGREKSNRVEYHSLACEKMLDIPIVLLLDANSASASEIVAGCLKDYGRAVLVGTRSFGKGSVQSVVPLPDKGAVRFTTAKYYTPSKRVIHGEGIEPNIPINIPADIERKLAQQRAAYPGEVKPNIPGAVSDPQLQRAIEILKGISLFTQAKKDE